jgi:hypothetical protein
MQKLRWSSSLVALALLAASVASVSAQTPPATPAAPAPAAPPHAALLKDGKALPGMLSVHTKGEQLFVELMPADYQSEYLVLLAISRGIGQGQILGGMTLGFGDDWVWQFRKVEDKVHIVRKNVRFKANAGSPESSAVKFAYTDSVLFSLPIATKGPQGGDLVDITQVFMSDLPQLSQALPGFSFSGPKSTWAKVKNFEKNLELEVAATYASGGMAEIETVPDSRGVTINIRYSITKIPQTGYQPRLADDRVGYFLSVAKDFSTKSDKDQFVRLINRWDLQKADPSAKLSPPKQPIVFWLEKTVPFNLRKTIREGILEWNKAFEAAGFANAIEVRQQPDDADWDPEDVRYNTFRWITSGAGFAMGPSRVNPYTGQILDADIIFDADFLQFWKEEYESLNREAIAEITGPITLQELQTRESKLPFHRSNHTCMLKHGMAQQFAFGTAAMAAANAEADPKVLAEKQEKLILQGLKEVTMHEVGHTLGLRHNFKASKLLSIADMNDPAKVAAAGGMVASVMDYSPTNIQPKGKAQGDYYVTGIGPYDIWAVEYGYSVFPGGTQGEVGELKKIAARSGEPALAFATDEDTRGGLDPDPDSNRFDLGSDPIEYARNRAELVQTAIPDLVERMTKDGDDYTQARRAFSILMAQHGNAMFYASRYVGGIHTSRSHKGDKDAKPPMRLVDTKIQRDALALLEDQMLSEKPFQYPAEMYNFLASSTWSHWGVKGATRKDFPVHDSILMWQERIIGQLLSPTTLERIHDAELKVSPDTDVLTTAELIERITKSIYSEVEAVKEGEFTNRKPAISSVRRNLQRNYLSTLSNMAMGNSGVPKDCETIAYAELGALDGRIKGLLANVNAKLDSYSRAHLQETSARIQKVLDAKLTLASP